MSVMKRRTLLALVAVAFVLFGLTLNSCKDCNSGKNRGKGKDPLGNGSSTDNSGNGSSEDNSGNGSSEGNSGNGSSEDNLGGGSSEGNSTSGNGSSAGNSTDENNLGGGSSEGNSTSGNGSSAGNSTDENNPVLPPKERRALTPGEQEELDGLKGELVAAAAVAGDDNGPIAKVRDITCPYLCLYVDFMHATDGEKWLANLYWMCFYQKYWADYLKKGCDGDRIPKDDDNESKEWVNKHKVEAEKVEVNGREECAKRENIKFKWNEFEPLLKQAKSDWSKLVTAENAYRGTLQRFGII